LGLSGRLENCFFFEKTFAINKKILSFADKKETAILLGYFYG
jgi:hypothetical protein